MQVSNGHFALIKKLIRENDIFVDYKFEGSSYMLKNGVLVFRY